jgi:hypothetical protein
MSDNIVQFPGKTIPEAPKAQPLAELMGTPTGDVRFLPLDIQLEIMRGVYMQKFTSNHTAAVHKAELLSGGVPHLIELADTIFKGICLPPEDAAVWFESPDPFKRSIDLVVGLGDYSNVASIPAITDPVFTKVKKYLQLRLSVSDQPHAPKHPPSFHMVSAEGQSTMPRLNARFAPREYHMTAVSIGSIVEAILTLVRKNCQFNTASIHSHPTAQDSVELIASLPFGSEKSIAITLLFDGQIVPY